MTIKEYLQDNIENTLLRIRDRSQSTNNVTLLRKTERILTELAEAMEANNDQN